MSVYISNELYLNDSGIRTRKNRPLVGWNSKYLLNEVSSDDFGSDSGYVASNVWAPETYTKWRVTNDTASVEDDDVGLIFSGLSQSSIDYAGIVGHNFATYQIAYQWQYSFTGDAGTWVDVTDERIPPNNSPIIDHFDLTVATFWRMRLVLPGNSFAQVAHIKLGKILKLERAEWGGVTPASMGGIVEGIASTSGNGNYLGLTITSKGNTWSINQKNNTEGHVRSEIIPFINHMNGTLPDDGTPQGAFLYAWRPDDYPSEVVYGWKSPRQEVHPMNQNNLFMEWKCSGNAIA